MIPPLFAPARLPPGAGTAVLNLIAGLMKDQGVARVRYRGPYPTEQLFTALLECFRHDPALDDPLRRFMDGGDVDWVPAPHERHLVAPGVSVQLRHQIDKVVLDGVAFYRRDWQGVIRDEPRVVREEGARVICSLWALGRSLEDRLMLDRSGEVQERPAPALDPIPPAPLPPVWAPALAELIARESAPALAAPLRDVLREADARMGRGPRRSPGGRRRARAREPPPPRGGSRVGGRSAAGPERAQRAIAFVVEVARLIAPAARLRAQARLAAASPAEQARALAPRRTRERCRNRWGGCSPSWRAAGPDRKGLAPEPPSIRSCAACSCTWMVPRRSRSCSRPWSPARAWPGRRSAWIT